MTHGFQRQNKKRSHAVLLQNSVAAFFVGAERGTRFFSVACVGATIGRPPTYRRNAFSGTVSCKANGHGRAMLAPTKVFRQSGPEIFRAAARFSPPPPAGGAPSQRGPREGARLSENEIRRGAFYMRPRKFALSQAGTGGYGIRPYVFEGTGVARPLHTMPTSPAPALQAWVSAVGFAPPSRGSIPTGLSRPTKTPTCFHTQIMI